MQFLAVLGKWKRIRRGKKFLIITSDSEKEARRVVWGGHFNRGPHWDG